MKKFINIITIIRILLAPVIFLLLIFNNYILCLILFLLAGLSDFFDGYLARKYNSESELGEILDPIADKVLIIFIFFGLALNLNSYLFAFLSSFILAREVFVAALRDYSSRKNISNLTKVTFIAKTKTAMQFFTIGSYIFALAIKLNLLIVISDVLLIITTLITIYSGYQYFLNIFNNR